VTTEDEFQAALDAQPKDWQTRLVFADWLYERSDPRAEGYRVLATLRMVPSHGMNAPGRGAGGELWWWSSFESQSGGLPQDWFALVEGLEPSDAQFKPRAMGGNSNTRQLAEDAAALAFGKLPAQRQAEILAVGTAGAKPRSPRPARRRDQ
jgi:uncharacterized protein (TIGR02996 family)